MQRNLKRFTVVAAWDPGLLRMKLGEEVAIARSNRPNNEIGKGKV